MGRGRSGAGKSLAPSAVFLLVLIVLLFFAGHAVGHSFYPVSCCSGQDCSPVDENEISENGPYFVYKGAEYPKRSALPSPDNNYHVCYIRPKGYGGRGHIQCMWYPQRSARRETEWARVKRSSTMRQGMCTPGCMT